MLVEPRLLEQLRAQSEYKELQKPTDKKTKAALSLNMYKILENDKVSDDIKAKQYQQAFSRYMSVKDKIPQPIKGKINWLAPLPPAPPPTPPSPPVTREASRRVSVPYRRVSPIKRQSTKKRPRKSPPTTSTQPLPPLPSDTEWED